MKTNISKALILISLIGCTKEKFISISKVAAPTSSAVSFELPIAHTREFSIQPKKVLRPVKLFFIIDDSPSMEQFQAKLIENTKRWVDVIGSDFVGEIHSVTTTELTNNTAAHIASPQYSILHPDGTFTYNYAALGVNTRFHGDWRTLQLTRGDNGMISVNRTQFDLDELTNEVKPWIPANGFDLKYTLFTKDKYQLLKSSLFGKFAGGSDQKARLEDTLFRAINRGATGSSFEQPYCAIMHALYDTGKLDLFKPEEKVAFIFLQHGEANFINDANCLSGFEMKARPISSAGFQIERYANYYEGDTEELIDQKGTDKELKQYQMQIYNCNPAHLHFNPLCKASTSQINEAKVKRSLITPLKPSWDGLIRESCDSDEETAYIAFLRSTFPGEFDGSNPKKIYRGNCKSVRGFAPWTYNPTAQVPITLAHLNCDHPDVTPLITGAINSFKALYPAQYVDSDFCYKTYDSLYETQEKKSIFFPGLDISSGPNEVSANLAKLMDEKIGRANYIISAVTTTGTGNPSCDPESFKATSLINLVKDSPSPNELISICEEDYTPALRRVEKFAIFEAIRDYAIDQLPAMERLVRIKVVSAAGNVRILPLSLIIISEDRNSFHIDPSAEIQPDDKLLFEYRNESPTLEKLIVRYEGAQAVRSKITLKGTGYLEGIKVKLSGIDCVIDEVESYSSLTCTLQDDVPAIDTITITNADGGSITVKPKVEVVPE